MSFILDALKKSESDRQRQSGPALFEVKIAPPKARFPAWAIAVAALLVINMAIVGWLLMRRSPHADEATAGTSGGATTSHTVVAASNTTPAQAPGNALSGTTGPVAAQVPVNTAQAPDSAAPSAAGAPGPAFGGAGSGSGPTVPPGNDVHTSAAARPGDGAADIADGAASEPTLARASSNDSSAVSGGNPDDYAPATEPEAANSQFKTHVRRGTDSGYTLYQDAAVAPGANLPQLRLDLHVYAAKPQDRFALINMHRLHEGDSLPEGVRVESITPDGVVMSHNGSKFFLPRN
jgi:general secretion pathway protein B